MRPRAIDRRITPLRRSSAHARQGAEQHALGGGVQAPHLLEDVRLLDVVAAVAPHHDRDALPRVRQPRERRQRLRAGVFDAHVVVVVVPSVQLALERLEHARVLVDREDHRLRHVAFKVTRGGSLAQPWGRQVSAGRLPDNPTA